MREYKFRGKQLNTGEWVFGNLIISSKLHFYISLFAYDGSEWNQCPLQLNCVQVDPKTVGQYVPSEDFYEGDILYGSERTNPYIEPHNETFWYGEVRYNEEIGRIMVWDIDDREWHEINCYNYDRVGGTIHDKENMKNETN